MCRFALYLGEPITISSLVTEPSHSIIHQSFQSQERVEPLNGDGFGIGWYAHGYDDPVIFKEVSPAWNSMNLRSLASRTESGCILAHVRAASPGLPVTQLNCHPFASGRLAFMHNGTVGGFRSVRRPLREGLSQRAYDGIEGSTDSELAFALLLDAYEADREAQPLERLASALLSAVAATESTRRSLERAEPSLLNFCLTDGQRAVASRFVSTPDHPSNSLYVHQGAGYECVDGVCRMTPRGDKPGAVIIASEPLSEDSSWSRVPENHLVLVDEELNVELRPIELDIQTL